jgi:Secretion system C-terminal sorting domain
MKIILNWSQKVFTCITVIWIFLSGAFLHAQQPITSILTENIVNSQVSYTGVKGAGLRNPSNTLISFWDSTASFTVNYNAAASANILRLTQFSVSSFTSTAITMPVDATVKLRRLANTDVGDARNYYNFWAKYSSLPAAGAASGTFNFTAPEVKNPEDAFVLNNLTSGYDNIFQNTIANPHFGNIERIDFITPAGLQCTNDTDRLQSGVAVIDRGTGDPFKIAAITALNASGEPSAFGNLLSVTAANFGGNLLAAAFTYGILINDIKYYSQSRPSTQTSQNLRGVYISLADLGITIGQRFYGYALFGPDVVTANPDWTTYPNNTNGGSQLDPVNILGFYKTPGSVLALPVRFIATRINGSAQLDFTLSNEFKGDHLAIEVSNDGTRFHVLEKIYTRAAGVYTYTYPASYTGNNYFRLTMTDRSGVSSVSEIRLLIFESKESISIFPNPATEKLNINFPSSWSREDCMAEIFNNAGQLIKSVWLAKPGNLESITIHTLMPGTYMLRLIKNKDQSAYSQSFIVM